MLHHEGLKHLNVITLLLRRTIWILIKSALFSSSCDSHEILIKDENWSILKYKNFPTREIRFKQSFGKRKIQNRSSKV